MRTTTAPSLLVVVLAISTIQSLNVQILTTAGDARDNAGGNPFAPKGYLMRYWRRQISNNSPKPNFLLNNASPLTAKQCAAFYKLASDQNSLTTQLPDFCSKANLLCFPDLTPSLEKHPSDVNFQSYSDKNFTNYGTDHLGGTNDFRGYSEGQNIIADSFRRYSRDATGRDDKFTAYATEGNVVDQAFNTYGAAARGGKGEFVNYNKQVNVPNVRFTSYSDGTNGREQRFTTYTGDANSGEETFTSYGKHGNGAANGFDSYGKNSNVMESNFNNYGKGANGDKDTFSSYGTDTNEPKNNFKSYGAGSNAATESFKSYRNQSNGGDDSFTSYGKKSNAATVDFDNYGQSFHEGTDKFTGYGNNNATTNPVVGFKTYGVNNTFKDYAKQGVTFARYVNESSGAMAASLVAVSGGKIASNKWVVEPGKFFREEKLKSGSVMPMPDIRDKMPKRSFLPRVIASKLPFSTSKLGELKRIFHAGDDESSMTTMLSSTLSECERAPSPGEMKRCVPSIEDMIDFVTSVLGHNVVVRSTESTNGYNKKIMIGQVKGINGGNVTKSVSCHQSLFPYMVYYCHSVPKVRVYEADILDPVSKSKINHGVAVCHLDTSSWSPSHGAFVALGSKPGKIEVCHWIFENDMSWTTAD